MLRAHLPYPLAVALLATSGIGGCGKFFGKEAPADETKDEGGGAPPSSAPPTANGECGAADFPCSWADVTPAVVERTQKVAYDVMGRVYDGASAKDAATAIDAEDDVVVLGYSDDAIRFRVRGGRPAWAFVATASSRPTLGGGVTLSPLTWAGPPADGAPTEPVGPNPPGSKPTKRVLILSPFRWHWQLGDPDQPQDDEVETIKAMFEGVEDYEGQVVLHQNTWTGHGIDRGVSIADFKSWRDYEVIHLSTHGTSCAGGKACTTAIATGDIWPDELTRKDPIADAAELPTAAAIRKELLDALHGRGLDMGFIPITSDDVAEIRAIDGLRVVEHARAAGPVRAGAGGHGTEGQLMDGDTVYFGGPFVLATTKFFEQAYGDKLTDKIVFLSACSSGAKSDLTGALAGPKTAVIGWDKVMRLDTASNAASLFWSYLLGSGDGDVGERGGRTVANAFDILERESDHAGVLAQGPLKSIVIEGIVTEDDATGAKLGPAGEAKTRAREIIRLLGEGDRRLDDGDFVALEGAPGDGKADALKLRAEVIGVGSGDDAGAYVIHVDVDGRTASSTFRPTERVADGVWRGEASVDLGFDLERGKTFALEPWVEMPTGGISRWHYDDIGVQYLVLTLSGPAFGTPQTVAIPPGRAGFQAFDSSFLLRFQDHFERNAVSADGTSLEFFIGGVNAEPIAVGELPLGASEGGNGFSMRFWLQAEGCPHDYAGCKNLTLQTRTGKIDVTKYQLGRGMSRPHEKGPTVATGTFEVAAEVTGMNREGEMYTIEGAFSLIE